MTTPPPAAPAPPLALRVMSYNIRFDDHDAVDGWEQRRGKVSALLKAQAPDLIGVQEALYHQLEDLEEALPGFGWTGQGREDGEEQGEFCAIFYDQGLLQLLDAGNFWLSPTPDEPSKGWDAALPRICSWARFRHPASGRTFYHFNTHFDHRGEEARPNASGVLVTRMRMKAKDEAVIVTGDLNVTPDTPAYETMVEGTLLQDAKQITQTPHQGPEGTMSGFDAEVPPSKRIDYIFVKKPLQVLRHAHLTEVQNGRYISDHLAVLAEVAFPAK